MIYPLFSLPPVAGIFRRSVATIPTYGSDLSTRVDPVANLPRTVERLPVQAWPYEDRFDLASTMSTLGIHYSLSAVVDVLLDILAVVRAGKAGFDAADVRYARASLLGFVRAPYSQVAQPTTDTQRQLADSIRYAQQCLSAMPHTVMADAGFADMLTMLANGVGCCAERQHITVRRGVELDRGARIPASPHLRKRSFVTKHVESGVVSRCHGSWYIGDITEPVEHTFIHLTAGGPITEIVTVTPSL